MGEVRGLFGEGPEPGQPVASCVDCLRDLLERAEAGDVVGIAVGMVDGMGRGSFAVGGMIGHYGLLAGTDLAKAQLHRHMLEDEYE
jgi:hypothetical protein